jgi:uncharacterized membrane protein YbaN (DUF454 family)
VTGTRRFLYRVFGWASVVMAIVGVILPGIPAEPFIVLAGYFFVRSSPAAHAWLRQSRWLGPFLRNWEDHGGVSRTVRNLALALILVGAVFSSLVGLPLPILLAVYAMQLACLIVVLNLPVIDDQSEAALGYSAS